MHCAAHNAPPATRTVNHTTHIARAPLPRCALRCKQEWITSANGAVGIEALRAIKQKLDPQNIFGAQNLLP